MSEEQPMKDVVISLRPGVRLEGRTLRDIVLSAVSVHITDVFPTGRRLVAHITDEELTILRRKLGDACRIRARISGELH